MNYKSFLFITILLLVLTGMSCKKYLEVGPPRVNLTGETVFGSDQTATAALLSVYTQMEQTGLIHAISIAGGIASDELVNHNTSAGPQAIASNNITPENSNVSTLWNSLYNYIYRVNAVLEGVEGNLKINEAVRKQLQGEGLFIRALCHFYLLNLFGNIPYNQVTDYNITSAQSQQNANAVLPLIITDLQTSKSLLPESYVNADNTASTLRVRPNKFAAAALLAKALLYHKKWAEAEAESSLVLQQSIYSLQTDLTKLFRIESPEIILQLHPVIPGFNSYAGGFLQPTATRPTSVSVSKGLVDSFEMGDKRRSDWITYTTYSGQDYQWLHKFKVGQNQALAEFTTLLRLAEVILIRAEARGMQDKFAPALEDLNKVRARAGLPALNITVRDTLLTAIYKERRLELFGETGDRWMDLVRTDRANQIMPPIKGSNWASTDQLFPIPQTEILRHTGIVQNPGY